MPALALRGTGQHNARLRIGQGLINGELSSVPERQATAHDLDPPGVAGPHINSHVSDANTARNTRSGLAADTGKGMLERQRPSRKDEVAHAVRWSPKGSRLWPQRHVRGQIAKAQPSKQQDPELCAGDIVTSSEVGRTVNARPECGPAWESNMARDAGKTNSKVHLEHARRRLYLTPSPFSTAVSGGKATLPRVVSQARVRKPWLTK